MTFNKNSRHLRFYQFITTGEWSYNLPRNLCQYFWRYVIALSGWSFLISFGLYGYVVLPLSWYLGLEKNLPWITAFVFWEVTVLTGICVVIVWSITTFLDNSNFDWIDCIDECCTAIKNRYCPRIQWDVTEKEPDDGEGK